MWGKVWGGGVGGTSADREIQRMVMELLSQLDGFEVLGKVRVCVWEGSVGRCWWHPVQTGTCSARSWSCSDSWTV